MKSQAVIFTGKNQVEWGEVDVPDPEAGDVVIRTTHSWISNGTEGSFLRQERFDGVTPWQPFMPLPFPMVPGYQKIGVVESVGKDVSQFKKGQTVFATITRVNANHLGFGGHLAVGPSPQHEVFALPEGDDPVAYSGLVLTQVAYNSAVRPPFEPGTPVLVMGDGMIGLWASQFFKVRGARVALAGRHASRLGLFAKGDGDITINGHDANWLQQALDWAGGSFPVILDTIGNDVNFDNNMKLIHNLRLGGHWVATGHEGFKSWIDLKQFIHREGTIHCPMGWTRERLQKTLDHIHAGDLKTLPFITDRLPANQAAEAWRKIFTEKDTTLGVILEWNP